VKSNFLEVVLYLLFPASSWGRLHRVRYKTAPVGSLSSTSHSYYIHSSYSQQERVVFVATAGGEFVRTWKRRKV